MRSAPVHGTQGEGGMRKSTRRTHALNRNCAALPDRGRHGGSGWPESQCRPDLVERHLPDRPDAELCDCRG